MTESIACSDAAAQESIIGLSPALSAIFSCSGQSVKEACDFNDVDVVQNQVANRYFVKWRHHGVNRTLSYKRRLSLSSRVILVSSNRFICFMSVRPR